MNAKIPFNFVILQYMHDTFTGEFLNVGIALFSETQHFLKVRLLSRYARITNTFPRADGELFRVNITKLQSKFDAIAESVNSGQLTLFEDKPLTIEKIVRKVLPPDDSALRFSPVYGGLAQDLGLVFEDFYHRFVEAHLPLEREENRDDQDIWRDFSKYFKQRNVINQLRSTTIHTPLQDIEIDHAWKNGKWNGIQPLSFDLQHASSIQRKSLQWFGAKVLINETAEVGKIFYILGKPRRDDSSVKKAYSKAKDLLGTSEAASRKVEIIEEDAAADFAREISAQIIADTSHR